MTIISLHPGTITAASSTGDDVVLDPIHAITAQIRYGDLHSWQQTRTPQDVAALLAGAEQIAPDYFVRTFPVVDLVSRP
jgi:hypothetical protein